VIREAGVDGQKVARGARERIRVLPGGFGIRGAKARNFATVSPEIWVTTGLRLPPIHRDYVVRPSTCTQRHKTRVVTGAGYHGYHLNLIRPGSLPATILLAHDRRKYCLQFVGELLQPLQLPADLDRPISASRQRIVNHPLDGVDRLIKPLLQMAGGLAHHVLDALQNCPAQVLGIADHKLVALLDQAIAQPFPADVR
jgi:hypothetical protein